MLVKDGYKQTEVGVIPEDWRIHDLGEIGEPIIGLTYTPRDVASHGTLVLRSSNVQGGRLSFLNNVYVSCEVREKVIVRDGDILICVRNGSRDLIGKCAQIVNPATRMAFGAFMSVYRTEFADYIFHQFQSDVIQKQISSHLGATINQITNGSLKSFKIPLPPTKAEQEAIAGALSDADAWIESLEQLIAKKRRIKEGTSQALLTGKQRLPGFSGDWEVKTLGEVIAVLADYTANGSFESLKTNVTYYSNKNYAALIRTTDLDKAVFSPERFTDKIGYEFLKKTSLTGGEIILANVGSIGKVFRVPNFNMPMTLAPNTYMLKFNESTSEDFIFQIMRTDTFVEKLKSKIGSTTLQAINKNNLREIGVLFPPSKAEQTAIAAILSDMDSELDALESKLSKARQIKQGMMQELLTGKTRLV